MTDIFEKIGQIGRNVAEENGHKTVTITRTFQASAPELWDACTDVGRLEGWFDTISGDLEPGGRFRLESTNTTGTIEECVPPSLLRATWEYEDNFSIVEVSIIESDGQSTLSLKHLMPEDDHWRTYGPAATGVGWEIGFLALALHLDGDDRAAPAEMEKAYSTPDASAFMNTSATAWAQVHIDSGADKTHAREAAARTVAFYTGVETGE